MKTKKNGLTESDYALAANLTYCALDWYGEDAIGKENSKIEDSFPEDFIDTSLIQGESNDVLQRKIFHNAGRRM